MTGRMVSHYRILSPLGSGGMGVVYLAEDERLGRQVALKFLPAAWSHERKALERFRVEARAASSLSHPAICAIFDIGEDGEVPFIVMEALKGETLRDRIARGPLKVSEVLDVGIQLADALGAAHDQGIVHRDIKPANIFLSDKNRVKVLDFGLAKLTSSASHLTSGTDTTSPASMRTVDNQITIPGTALGTVSYMSPEQARGEEVDSRTDLFSLGAVLYEMVTGTQAFGGSTTAVVYDAILNRSPRPIARLNPLVPPRLEALIATSLEKDREYRQQHASDLEAELKRIRRDIDSGASRMSASAVPAAAPAETLPAITVPPAATDSAPKRRSERIAVIIAVATVLLAGLWVFRDVFKAQLRTEPEAVTATTAAPPAAPASVPPEEARTQETASVPPPAPTPTPEAAPSRPAAPVRETPRESPRSDASAGERARPSPSEPPRQPPSPSRQTEPATPPRVPESSTTRVRELPLPPTQQAPAARPPEPQPTPRAAEPQQPTTAAAGAAAGGSATAPEPAAAPPVRLEPAPQAPVATVPPPSAAPPPASSTPGAPGVAPQPTPAPGPRATAPPPSPPAAPAETDDAAIRRVIRTFERAIETKNFDLYRSVRPRLSATDEAVLRQTFSLPDSQQVDIQVNSIQIDGRRATARLTRRDTLIAGGRPRTENSTPTMHFEKTDAGWIIAD